nr:hypothetical protein Hi04_10k_c5653_00005 [uncultured bacterium]
MTKHARLVAQLATLIVLVLVTCGVAEAQSPDGAARQASSPGADIKVHGHWTIEVRNPDGTVASHNEFENACVSCGQALAPLLARSASVWFWTLILSVDGTTSGPCMDDNSQATQCYITEPVAPNDPSNSIFKTLALSVTGTLNLTGHLAAGLAGEINRVDALLYPTAAPQVAFSLGVSQRPLSWWPDNICGHAPRRRGFDRFVDRTDTPP